jgi:hypothetical protein
MHERELFIRLSRGKYTVQERMPLRGLRLRINQVKTSGESVRRRCWLRSPSTYLLQIFWWADKQRDTLSRGYLPEFARDKRRIGVAICREQDHVVTLYPAEPLSFGQIVGRAHVDLIIP